MSVWTPPPPSPRGLAALTSLAAPSTPQPLPNSRSLGAGSYYIDMTAAQVFAAYQAPNAPVPTGSTFHTEGTVLIINSPFAASGVVASAAGSGSVYIILTAPTVVVAGAGAIPNISAFGRVAIQLTNDGQPSAFGQFMVNGAFWSIDLISDLEDTAAPTTRTAYLGRGALDDVLTAKPPRVNATINATGITLTATLAMSGGPVTVTLTATDGAMPLMAELAPKALAASAQDPSSSASPNP